MFELALPLMLLLLPLPLLLSRMLPSYRHNTPAIRTPFFEDYSRLLGDDDKQHTASTPVGLQIVFALCWVLLILALARPQYIEEPIVKKIATRDLLLAVDLSGSMETGDFTNQNGRSINRLEAVKEVLHDFLLRRQGDRVGLIFFGTAPFVQVPFTEDLDVCTVLLDEAQVGMAGPQTMIGDAIGLAITIFDKSDVKNKVLILLTDGNDTGSRIPPEEAARIGAERDIVIHTVAVGDPEAAGEAELDVATLQAIAKVSQGSYFHANDRDELEHIYEELDQLDTREVETVSYRPKRDLFHWPLGLLLLLSLSSNLYRAVIAGRTPSPEEM